PSSCPLSGSGRAHVVCPHLSWYHRLRSGDRETSSRECRIHYFSRGPRPSRRASDFITLGRIPMRHVFQIAASVVALLTFLAQAQAEPVPPPAKKGVLIVHITEGYTSDYRELDPTNPGMFHRGQIGRGAWKIGSKEAAYYEPLKPAAGDRDLYLPPRSQASGFGGTGLSEILRSKGIKNVAVAGFTSDVCVYATVLSAYDLGFHVYALREGMVGFFDGMAEQMVNFVYPMWSQVVDNDEFDKMVEASPTAPQGVGQLTRHR